MEISVKADVRKVRRRLNRIQRQQIPFATSVAINNTAKHLAGATGRDPGVLGRSMSRYMDRPRKQTINSLRYTKSTKRNLVASVYPLPWADEYLQYLVYGGTERRKKNRLVAPVDKARTNAHGNITGKRRGTFIRKRDWVETYKGVTGVWTQKGKNGPVRLVHVFKNSMQYKKQWPFHRLAQRSVQKNFPRFMDRALDRALRSAR